MTTSNFDYRDRQGKEIPLLQWADLHADGEYRFLRRDTLPNGRYVVTIWNGIRSPIVPGLFTTGVFSSGPGPSDEERLGKMLTEKGYETEAEALAGHAALMEEWGGRK